MPKKRVHEIAKEQGLTSKEVIKALTDAGVYVKAASSAVEERDIRRAFPNGSKARAAAGEAAKSGSSKGAVKEAPPETVEAPDAAAQSGDGASAPATPARTARAKAVKSGDGAAAPD